MSSTVDLSFRYLERDYARALRAHYASTLRLRLDIAAVFVLGVVGIGLCQSPATRWFGITCVTVAALFILTLVAAYTIIPKIVFRREPKFGDEYSLSFSPEGIHFRTANIDSQLQWSMYSRALIDAHSYLLYYGSRQFTVIPKRVFANSEQQQAFEQLLTQHVPKIVRRGAGSIEA